MIEDLVKENERDIQFFLVENLETCLHIVSELFLVYWKVLLGKPVTVQDRSLQGNLENGVCVCLKKHPPLAIILRCLNPYIVYDRTN